MKMLGHGGLCSLQQIPPTLSWCLTSSTAAAISCADWGMSATVASQLLDELRWTECQLGNAQGSFGYALTQVMGELLGGGSHRLHCCCHREV